MPAEPKVDTFDSAHGVADATGHRLACALYVVGRATRLAPSPSAEVSCSTREPCVSRAVARAHSRRGKCARELQAAWRDQAAVRVVNFMAERPGRGLDSLVNEA